MTLVVASLTSAQINNGTVIVYWYKNNTVAVAADSRTTEQSGEHRDTECKLFTFADDFIFGISGLSGRQPSVMRAGWSGGAMAKAAYVSVDSRDDNFVQRIADRWATAMVPFLLDSLHEPQVVELLRTKAIVSSGLFIGRTASHQLKVVQVDLYRDMWGETPRISPEISLREAGWLGWIGNVAIPPELLSGETDRAKAFREPLERKYGRLDRTPSVDFVDLFVSRIVELDATGFTAKPIDVVEITSDGPPRWYRRKQNCQD